MVLRVLNYRHCTAWACNTCWGVLRGAERCWGCLVVMAAGGARGC